MTFYIFLNGCVYMYIYITLINFLTKMFQGPSADCKGSEFSLDQPSWGLNIMILHIIVIPYWYNFSSL